ncbi:MAG: hypothetical protein WAU39_15445 [Polyangiales bacterium]
MSDRRSRSSLLRALVALLLLSGITACKTFADQTLRTRTALDANDPRKALRASNAALGVDNAGEIPEPLEKNDALLLLDRAMVLQALADYQASSKDFEVADKALEILDFSRSTANEITRYLFTDSAGPYKARPYEKLMLNSLNMVNYLALGDLEDARVEARRFTVMRDFLRGDEGAPREVDGADIVGSYLAGYTFEQSGNAEEALRYYADALRVKKLSSLAEPVQRLMQRSGYRTPVLQSVVKDLPMPAQPSTTEHEGELLIIVSYGRVPALRARRVPIGIALSVAAAFLPIEMEQQARRLAGQGLVTWVNYPELGEAYQYSEPVVTVNDVTRAFEAVADVDAIARQAWERSKGRVMAAAVIRMIARGAIGAGVGVATGKATDQSGVGVLAALLTQAAMVAADKPDTRSWATLPAHIGVVRTRVPPGSYQIGVSISGRNYVADVKLEAGQWLLLDFTDLSTS